MVIHTSHSVGAPATVRHGRPRQWVADIANLTQPDRVCCADDSQAECDRLCAEMLASGTLRRLNPEKRPNSCLALPDPTDVARVVDRTFICSARRQDHHRGR